MAQAQNIKNNMDANQKIVDMVSSAGGITTAIEQSDKLGFDWHVYRVNNVVVRKEYVKQENPVGTSDNPIDWNIDLELIPNGYYIHGGVIKIWTGEFGMTASWDDGRFAQI